MKSNRPVTLQQALTKIVTGIVAARLTEAIAQGAVLDPAQAGFVRGGEVGTQLQSLCAILEHALQARQKEKGAEGTGEVHLCMFDFSNAYTTVRRGAKPGPVRREPPLPPSRNKQKWRAASQELPRGLGGEIFR